MKNKDDLRVVRAFKIGQNDETDKRMFLKISPVVQFDVVKLENEFYVRLYFILEIFQEIRRAQGKDQNLTNKQFVKQGCCDFHKCSSWRKCLEIIQPHQN